MTGKLRQEEIWEARLLNSLAGHRFKPLDGWRPPLWRLRQVRTLPVPVQNLYGSHLDLQPIYLCLYTSCIPFTLQACHNPLTLLNMPRFERYSTENKVLFYVKLFFSFSFSPGALKVLVLWLPGEWKAKRNSALTARHTSRRNDEGNDKTQLRLLVYCDG